MGTEGSADKEGEEVTLLIYYTLLGMTNASIWAYIFGFVVWVLHLLAYTK